MIGAAIFWGVVVLFALVFFSDAMENDVFRYTFKAVCWSVGALLFLHWCNYI
jgi:hypothetical protein